MSTFNLGDPAPINPHDSNELKNLKKAYNESVIQRKLLDKQSTAIDSIKFFSELYVIHNDIVYLKHIITETNIALKTISELLLMKTPLTLDPDALNRSMPISKGLLKVVLCSFFCKLISIILYIFSGVSASLGFMPSNAT